MHKLPARGIIENNIPKLKIWNPVKFLKSSGISCEKRKTTISLLNLNNPTFLLDIRQSLLFVYFQEFSRSGVVRK
jgi:hypothetical protein